MEAYATCRFLQTMRQGFGLGGSIYQKRSVICVICVRNIECDSISLKGHKHFSDKPIRLTNTANLEQTEVDTQKNLDVTFFHSQFKKQCISTIHIYFLLVILLYCHLQHHNDTIIKMQEDFFNKIFTSHFIARVRKGCVGFYCERELRPNRNCSILTPNLMAVNVVSFSFSRCSTGSPGVHSAGCWLSLLHLISNFSGPQTPSGFPRAPSAGCGFPYHISSITPSPIVAGTGTGSVLTSVLTELYNRLTSTRSTTRSLKSHVWSSSSGNNWHAVHRSLSSGASVYECTMGIFF